MHTVRRGDATGAATPLPPPPTIHIKAQSTSSPSSTVAPVCETPGAPPRVHGDHSQGPEITRTPVHSTDAHIYYVTL